MNFEPVTVEMTVYVCPCCLERFYDETDCRNHIGLCGGGRLAELDRMLDCFVVNSRPDGRLNAVGYVSNYDPSYTAFGGTFMLMPWTDRDDFGTDHKIPLEGNRVVSRSEARRIYLDTLDSHVSELLSEVFGEESEGGDE